ncbi:hypothetical protein QCA50_010480 [Cerrena zonata]|uniref:Cell cycle checkpoint control protein n=1 Tax=Cerrena zonata TaxID=2478898 RepID=A0AAW0GB17_9APHY
MPTPLQATLDSTALKQLIRILTCLSKYGDDLIILASPDRLLLHTTNLSQTAYGRIIYSKHFFSRYRVDQPLRDDGYTVDGQLSTKSLLSVLKPRTVERTVDKCDLLIVYGDSSTNGQNEGGEGNDEEIDSLESKLIVRLHCKHGVVKTHRLLLSETTRHMAPNVPESPEQSNLTIPPKNLKDILDQFHTGKGKGGKNNDLQLIWTFDVDNVFVRAQESLTVKGNDPLTTEFIVSADEFTIYDVYAPPTTVAFHLREFGAVMAFAESSNHAVNLQFTVNGNPLFVQPDNGDFYETLFIIALSQFEMPNTTNNNSQTSNRSAQRQIQPQRRKRPLETDSVHSASPSSVNGNGSERGAPPLSQIRQRIEKAPVRPRVPAQPMKAVVSMDRAPSMAQDDDSHFPGGSMPPPSLPASLMKQQPLSIPSQRPAPSQQSQQEAREEDDSPPPTPRRRASQIPLFLPGSQLSQLSKADEEAIINSGLGIEDMDMDEFQAMMEGDGEEVELNSDEENAVKDKDVRMRESSLDIFEAETQLPPTQESTGSKIFKPLFDD